MKNNHSLFIISSIMLIAVAWITFPNKKFKINHCYNTPQGEIKIIKEIDQKVVYKIKDFEISKKYSEIPDHLWIETKCSI